MLFGLFADDLAHIKLDVGLPCGVFLLAILIFADDIVLIAENECKLQCLLDVLHEWCVKLQINPKKAQVVNFPKKARSLYSFSCAHHSPTLRSISTLVFG